MLAAALPKQLKWHPLDIIPSAAKTPAPVKSCFLNGSLRRERCCCTSRRHSHVATRRSFGTALHASGIARAQTVSQERINLVSADSGHAWSDAELESLKVLEWPAVCQQVASFCSTVMATELVAAGQLPIGCSQQESELLLQQTAEALAADLQLKGIYDLRPALDAAAAGGCLNAKQLEGVASSLELAFAAKEAACALDPSTGANRYPALAELARSIDPEDLVALRAIRHCIKLGSVVNEASEELAEVRAQRAANKERLRAVMDEQARLAFDKGASESRSINIMRGRFCLGVRAGRQSDLPKGSIKLGQSQTGATVYYEPQPAIELNNWEALLEDEEKVQVQKVLLLLTHMLTSRSKSLLSIMASITDLDIASARSKHAKWLGAVRPAFTAHGVGHAVLRTAAHRPAVEGQDDDAANSSLSLSPVHVPGARHPILMQPALESLPEPPSVDDNRFDRNYSDAPPWELRRRFVGTGSSGQRGEASRKLPAPLDLRVPANKTAVSISGPNTGGKTVTLKTVGLMVLMAKAGLFLPVDHQEVSRHGPPQVRWFDRVLADIGDSQSLQQSLSTFSGHIQRIQRILKVATPNSLVLLDEVGSGTDPLEGAALARAILDRLAGQAALTFATTHHAELKGVAEEDERWVNVSMTFDVATLRPTYQLVWGSAGASNALDIAQVLGFDSSVIREARYIAKAAAIRARDREGHLKSVAQSLEAQLKDVRAQLGARQRARASKEAQAEKLRALAARLVKFNNQLKATPRAIVKERDALRDGVTRALERLESGTGSLQDVESELKKIEVMIPHLVAQHKGRQQGTAQEGDPRPGDVVYVDKFGQFGRCLVESVAGKYLRVRLLNELSAFDFTGFTSGKLPKVLKSEAKVISRAGAAGAAGPAWDNVTMAPAASRNGNGNGSGLVDGHMSDSPFSPGFISLMEEVEGVLDKSSQRDPVQAPEGVEAGPAASTVPYGAGWQQQQQQQHLDWEDQAEFSDYDDSTS